MSVKVQCPNPECGHTYKVPEEQLGRTAVCKHCGKKFALAASQRETIRSAGSADTLQPALGLVSGDMPRKLGRFDIRSRIGAGGFGAVYRGHDPTLDREVALKVPHRGLLQTEDDKARFLREPRAAAKLRHPNIVPVYEAGADGDQYYIVSAFIEGQTLKEAIETERPDFSRTAEIVHELADALDYAHQQGIIHRDVKPANVMLDTLGTPLLMDFGLARFEGTESQLTHEGTVLGTPAYMSPEQASGAHDRVGPASDQYSLGAVLYELLCSETPFSGPPALVISMVINREPPSLRQFNPRVPLDLETICAKAMSKRPEQRYANCRELAADLQRWLNGEPIVARRVNPAERLWRWCRRKPVVAGLAATAALLVLLVAVVASVGYVRTSAAYRRAEAEKKDKEIALAREKEERQRADESAEKERQSRQQAEEHQKKAEEERKRAEQALQQAESERRRAEDEEKRSETLVTQVAELEKQAPEQYRNFIALAHQKCMNKDPFAALEILRQCGPRLRGWEWFYLRRLCDIDVITVDEDGAATSVAFSPDGERIASSYDSGKLALCYTATGEKVFSVGTGDKGKEKVTALVFSPDGNWIAGSHADSSVTVWDSSAGRLAFSVAGQTARVTNQSFSPDGARIAFGYVSGQVKIHDAASGQEISTFGGHFAPIKSVSLAPDGKWIASSCGSRTRVTEVATGREVWTRSVGGAVMFSPDGKRLLASGEEDAKLFDADNGQELFSAGGGGRFFAFGADGKSIILLDNLNTARTLDPSTGRQLRSLAAADVPLTKLHVSKGGKLIAAVGDDKSVRVWEETTGQQVFVFRGHIQPVQDVAIRPDGKQIASAGGNVKIWRPEANQESAVLKGHDDAVTSVTFSTDGARIASGSKDKTLRVWDANNGNSMLTLTTREVSMAMGTFAKRTVPGHTAAVTSVAFSDRFIVSASEDRSVRLWDANTGVPEVEWDSHYMGFYEAPYGAEAPGVNSRVSPYGQSSRQAKKSTGHDTRDPSQPGGILRLSTHDVPVWGVADDGSRGAGAVTGAADGTIRIWEDLRRGTVRSTLSGHIGGVRSVAVSVDHKRIASGAEDKTVRLWDAAAGRELLTLRGHSDEVRGVAFSPDGKRIASASLDNTLKVWDVESGQELLTLHGHARGVNSVAFSPDGRRIVSASLDDTIRVWDAGLGHELIRLLGHTGGVLSVAFNEDGKLASGAGDKTVRVWDAGARRRVTIQGLAASPPGRTRIWEARLSPDCTLLAGKLEDRVSIWNTNTGAELATLAGRGQRPVAFSPDGKNLVTDGFDMTGQNDRVILWDAATGKSLFTLGTSPHVSGESPFSADGKYIATRKQPSSFDSTIWDARSGKQVFSIELLYDIAFSGVGAHVAGIVGGRESTPSYTLKVWNTSDGREVFSLPGGQYGIDTFALSADGKRVVCLLGETARVWDTTSGKELVTLAGKRADFGDYLAFSPDGRWIAGAMTVIWDANTGKQLFALPGGRPYHARTLVFSPDGRRVITETYDVMTVWDVSSGKVIFAITNHGNRGTPVFSRDGRLFACWMEREWGGVEFPQVHQIVVRLWDAVTGAEAPTLVGNTGKVVAVAFSLDGERIVSVGEDGTVNSWNVGALW